MIWVFPLAVLEFSLKHLKNQYKLSINCEKHSLPYKGSGSGFEKFLENRGTKFE